MDSSRGKTKSGGHETAATIANGNLLHQQHLAGAFDGAGHAALVMRGQAGVFEIERVHGEVNLRLRSRRAVFHRAARAALVLFGVRLAWHNYLISLCKV